MTKGEKVGLAVAGVLALLASQKAKAAVAYGPDADAKLLTRANSKKAAQWVGILISTLNLPANVAAAVARWFGIESGGDPLAVSPIGERGLAQITKTSALTEGAITPAEWDALSSKSTSTDEQVRINWKIIQWCYGRAVKYIQVPPAHDELAQVWYAKLYQQRPVDVRDAELTGEATADAWRLEMEWAGDAAKLHRLHAANVVAWNALTPPHPPLAQK